MDACWESPSTRGPLAAKIKSFKEINKDKNKDYDSGSEYTRSQESCSQYSKSSNENHNFSQVRESFYRFVEHGPEVDKQYQCPWAFQALTNVKPILDQMDGKFPDLSADAISTQPCPKPCPQPCS